MAVVFIIIGLCLQPPTALGAILCMAYMPFAAAITYGLNVLVATIAFYTTEANSVKNVVAHVINVFSGTLIPLSLFPPLLKMVAITLPFSATVFGPIQALHTTALQGASLTGLLSACVWAIALVIIGELAWRKGVRHYEAVGI